MLKPITQAKFRAAGARFAIVASRYNAHYVDAMVSAAQAEFTRSGAKSVKIIRVPGAYEIPLAASRLAQERSRRRDSSRGPFSAIICLGVILRGETVHAAHIGENVSRALMDIQLRYEVPVIHEVLLLENERQAQARCSSKTHNRGTEAAQTALAMAEVMKKISG